jgi:hypothetical protein
VPYLTVGEAARELGCLPSVISNAIYRGAIDPRRCPLLGGRRHIPRDYLPQIAKLLRRNRTEYAASRA